MSEWQHVDDEHADSVMAAGLVMSDVTSGGDPQSLVASIDALLDPACASVCGEADADGKSPRRRLGRAKVTGPPVDELGAERDGGSSTASTCSSEAACFGDLSSADKCRRLEEAEGTDLRNRRHAALTLLPSNRPCAASGSYNFERSASSDQPVQPAVRRSSSSGSRRSSHPEVPHICLGGPSGGRRVRGGGGDSRLPSRPVWIPPGYGRRGSGQPVKPHTSRLSSSGDLSPIIEHTLSSEKDANIFHGGRAPRQDGKQDTSASCEKLARAFLLQEGFEDGVNGRRKSVGGFWVAGYTYPLHAAVRANCPRVVEGLLMLGAAASQADSSGHTPMTLARRLSKEGSHQAIIEALSG